jgi:hypothetical protein
MIPFIIFINDSRRSKLGKYDNRQITLIFNDSRRRKLKLLGSCFFLNSFTLSVGTLYIGHGQSLEDFAQKPMMQQTAKTLSAMQGRKNEIGRKVICLGMWHVGFSCACFIYYFFFFPIPEFSVSSVDRPVPKNDGRE